MIDQIYTFFTIDMIYIWLTLGILPLWILLIFFPQIKISKIFVTSIFPLIILAAVNSYLIYTIYRNEINYLDAFNLYLNFDELLILFSDKNFAILFWIHFLAINLFCGSWIVRDYQKINMPKFLAFFPLILTYFTGPIGLSIYWLLRIFYSKKIDMYD